MTDRHVHKQPQLSLNNQQQECYLWMIKANVSDSELDLDWSFLPKSLNETTTIITTAREIKCAQGTLNIAENYIIIEASSLYYSNRREQLRFKRAFDRLKS